MGINLTWSDMTWQLRLALMRRALPDCSCSRGYKIDTPCLQVYLHSPTRPCLMS